MSDIDKRVYRFSGSKFVTLGYHVQRIKQLEDELKRTLKTEQRTAEMNGKLLITIRELKALEGKR